MATTNLTKMKIAETMIPAVFQGEEDLDIFIEDCKRYFELCALDEASQGIIIKCLIRRDLLPIYEAVKDVGQTFEERMREAFQKPSSLIGDFMEIFNYEKESDAATVYFEKVEKLVKRLMKHRWNEEELVAYFLVHCVKDKETKREIRMRDAKKIDEIKSIITKVDAINVEVSGLGAIQRKETFANVVKRRQEYAELQKYRTPIGPQYPERRFETNNVKTYPNSGRRFEGKSTMTCWNCGEIGHSSSECRKGIKRNCYSCGREGHISRECQESTRKFKSCWACKEEGHTRDECPNVSCSGCKRRGHLKFQCRENQQRNFNQSWNRSRNFNGYRRNQVAAMMTDDDAIRASMKTDYDDDAIDGSNYPKVRAPSVDEMIGAME